MFQEFSDLLALLKDIWCLYSVLPFSRDKTAQVNKIT